MICFLFFLIVDGIHLTGKEKKGRGFIRQVNVNGVIFFITLLLYQLRSSLILCFFAPSLLLLFSLLVQYFSFHNFAHQFAPSFLFRFLRFPPAPLFFSICVRFWLLPIGSCIFVFVFFYRMESSSYIPIFVSIFVYLRVYIVFVTMSSFFYLYLYVFFLFTRLSESCMPPCFILSHFIFRQYLKIGFR